MTVLLTNAQEFAGPGVLSALAAAGRDVVCHDRGFVSNDTATEFLAAHPSAAVLVGQSPEQIADELRTRGIRVTGLVNNDVLPNIPTPIESIPEEHFQIAFQSLVLFPLRLSQLLLPLMIERKSGSIVFVTSARYRQHETGFAVATSIRAGATALAQAMAREVATHGIQVNVVAPNFLASEAYYPAARFVEDPDGARLIKDAVPMGRLGRPDEIGALVAFLIGGSATFVTGQVIDFTGGWP